ncbi:hypothetical protein [Hymenobacter psychrophilus]|uniref:Uncharacterized protein n=1 Tax=Hymenobacter psychrophilus TaxID=651662 RepID=A0A1H3G0I6_9BACT|nr:hypothetical protein [Hymenobacter psychrophilus]SDX96823.1 hypothetical protein SAMN04488069_104299 [Hymenobacter psychrophilus]
MSYISAKMAAAVENIYQVFACYPLNPAMEGSPVYADTIEAWNKMLAAKPLRNLTEEDLQIFYFKALTTWGDVNDFRYFLPRILELLTAFSGNWEEWVALDKLCYGHWKTWPETEQKAIRHYLLTLWREVLISESEMANISLGDYLAAIANVYPDSGQLIQLWHQIKSSHKIPRLVDFVYKNPQELLGKKRLSIFDKAHEQSAHFFSWLTSAALMAELTADFFRNPSSAYATELSAVIRMLEEAAKK